MDERLRGFSFSTTMVIHKQGIVEKHEMVKPGTQSCLESTPSYFSLAFLKMSVVAPMVTIASLSITILSVSLRISFI